MRAGQFRKGTNRFRTETTDDLKERLRLREDKLMAKITEKVKDFFTTAHVNMGILHGLLSEFLAVEMGGQALYERALELGSDTEVRTKFRQFLKQTINHQKVLTYLIRKLGGNPRMQSPGAKVAAAKAQGLLRTMGRVGLTKDAAQLNAI